MTFFFVKSQKKLTIQKILVNLQSLLCGQIPTNLIKHNELTYV